MSTSDEGGPAWAVQKSLDGTILRRFSHSPFDDGGLVSGRGSMPSSTWAPEVRFTDEQSAAFVRAQEGVSRWAERQIVAENEAREGAARAHLVERVRSALERQLGGEFLDPSDADSMKRAADVAVGVFLEVLRDPPSSLVIDADGVARVESSDG